MPISKHSLRALGHRTGLSTDHRGLRLAPVNWQDAAGTSVPSGLLPLALSYGAGALRLSRYRPAPAVSGRRSVGCTALLWRAAGTHRRPCSDSPAPGGRRLYRGAGAGRTLSASARLVSFVMDPALAQSR